MGWGGLQILHIYDTDSHDGISGSQSFVYAHTHARLS